MDLPSVCLAAAALATARIYFGKDQWRVRAAHPLVPLALIALLVTATAAVDHHFGLVAGYALLAGLGVLHGERLNARDMFVAVGVMTAIAPIAALPGLDVGVPVVVVVAALLAAATLLNGGVVTTSRPWSEHVVLAAHTATVAVAFAALPDELSEGQLSAAWIVLSMGATLHSNRRARALAAFKREQPGRYSFEQIAREYGAALTSVTAVLMLVGVAFSWLGVARPLGTLGEPITAFAREPRNGVFLIGIVLVSFVVADRRRPGAVRRFIGAAPALTALTGVGIVLHAHGADWSTFTLAVIAFVVTAGGMLVRDDRRPIAAVDAGWITAIVVVATAVIDVQLGTSAAAALAISGAWLPLTSVPRAYVAAGAGAAVAVAAAACAGLSPLFVAFVLIEALLFAVVCAALAVLAPDAEVVSFSCLLGAGTLVLTAADSGPLLPLVLAIALMSTLFHRNAVRAEPLEGVLESGVGRAIRLLDREIGTALATAITLLTLAWAIAAWTGGHEPLADVSVTLDAVVQEPIVLLLMALGIGGMSAVMASRPRGLEVLAWMTPSSQFVLHAPLPLTRAAIVLAALGIVTLGSIELRHWLERERPLAVPSLARRWVGAATIQVALLVSTFIAIDALSD